MGKTRKITASNKYKELKAELSEIVSTETVLSKAIDKLIAQSKEVLSRKSEVKAGLAKLASFKKESIDFKIEDTEEGLVLDLESGDAKEVVVDGDVIKGEGDTEEGEFGDEFGGEETHDDFDFENIDNNKPEGMPNDEPEEVVDIEKRMKLIFPKYNSEKNATKKASLKKEFDVLATKRKRILSAKK